MNYFIKKDRMTSIKKKKNYLSQLTICCKQTEMLFDSLQCNSRGKIGKLRD